MITYNDHDIKDHLNIKRYSNRKFRFFNITVISSYIKNIGRVVRFCDGVNQKEYRAMRQINENRN